MFGLFFVGQDMEARCVRPTGTIQQEGPKSRPFLNMILLGDIKNIESCMGSMNS